VKLKVLNEDYEEDQMLDDALKKYARARDRDEDKEKTDPEAEDKKSDEDNETEEVLKPEAKNETRPPQ
jgi:hypothetical protein